MLRKLIAAIGLKRDADEEITEVIDMYDAMLVHSAWKKRLIEYLEGRSKEELLSHNISVDNRCVLGKWIHSDGRAQLGEQTEFIKLVEEHAKFHQEAAKVVEAHQIGNTSLAHEILKGSFEEQSRRTVTCLTRLNALVEGHEKTSVKSIK